MANHIPEYTPEQIEDARKLDKEQAALRGAPDLIFPSDLGARLVSHASHPLLLKPDSHAPGQEGNISLPLQEYDYASPMFRGKAGPDSHALPKNETQEQGADADSRRPADDARQSAAQQATGDVLPASPAEPPAAELPPARESLAVTFKRRMEQEGRWKAVSLVRDQMMKDAKREYPDIEARREWVYSELDRMYPAVHQSDHEITTYDEKTRYVSSFPPDSGQIRGLGKIPEGWPELPANASLASEIGWVQANRLFMVEEQPGKATVVKLDQAASPAPSRAALGWLETSIRSYAKYVDVAAKVSGGADDEGAVMRAERKSIDEVRALFEEMKAEPFVCPHCGKVIE